MKDGKHVISPTGTLNPIAPFTNISELSIFQPSRISQDRPFLIHYNIHHLAGQYSWRLLIRTKLLLRNHAKNETSHIGIASVVQVE